MPGESPFVSLSKPPAPFTLVLFGATGFTGELTADYLAANAPESTRWALAGRNQRKLEGVRERLAASNPALADVALLHADVDDPSTVREVAEQARVVITTVGPYINYGDPVVAACAEAGSDYVDLTGESEFVDLMYVRHHATASETGARIVHACGFDSIPHDLGAQFTVEQLPEDVPIKVEGFVRAGGTLSGGTFHTAVTGQHGRETPARRVRFREQGRLRRPPRPAACRRGARAPTPRPRSRPSYRGGTRARPCP